MGRESYIMASKRSLTAAAVEEMLNEVTKELEDDITITETDEIITDNHLTPRIPSISPASPAGHDSIASDASLQESMSTNNVDASTMRYLITLPAK